jgi:hypothetical protein
MDDIAQWLDRHGLSKYTQVFKDNELTVELLSELDEADLRELGLPMLSSSQ